MRGGGKIFGVDRIKLNKEIAQEVANISGKIFSDDQTEFSKEVGEMLFNIEDTAKDKKAIDLYRANVKRLEKEVMVNKLSNPEKAEFLSGLLNEVIQKTQKVYNKAMK